MRYSNGKKNNKNTKSDLNINICWINDIDNLAYDFLNYRDL